jgi:succinate dehydrogenase / fumarate reductase cytochrome b subunit
MSRSGLFSSSLGRKYLMGITGLFLCIFLIQHLAGNFLLYAGDGGKAFNAYAKYMSSNPLVRVLEVVLVAGFLLHIIDGIMLWIQNRKARPEGYAYPKSTGKKAGSTYARTMKYTGTVILVFLIIHMKTFWYKLRFGGEHDAYGLVVDWFGEWWYALIYVISMLLLAGHLNHGFQSAFRTLGVNHPKYNRGLEVAGSIFAAVMTIGFMSFPIYFYFFG